MTIRQENNEVLYLEVYHDFNNDESQCNDNLCTIDGVNDVSFSGAVGWLTLIRI